jgi:minor extracellular serine protease Vpr
MLKQAAALGSLAALLACGAKGAPTEDRSTRFKLSPVQADAIGTSFTPLGNPNRKVTVVLQLAGEPVASVQASRRTKLAVQEKALVAAALAVQQEVVAEHVKSRGGEVLAKLQHAINGVKVRVKQGDLAALAGVPGVLAVRPVRVYRPVDARADNAVSVPFIGATAAWDDAGVRGEGVKIAVLDTGIDYTHANFGGPGTTAAFEAASATSTLPADPALFGPNAPKVKGGTDLVGDDYDASSDDPARTVPHPDPNPLDCNGHGSHVSGTATGFGVNADGTTYAGPYTAPAVRSTAFRIGPGVAPKADLYMVRVFGCEGSTDVVTEAIDWAVANGMDVINMSLGADFGSADDADAVASENAASAGVLVVASAGNAGPGEYITGVPAAGQRVISVAAMDSTPAFPAASVALSPSGLTIVAQDSNGAPLPSASLPVVVLRNADQSISRGCDEAEYVDSVVAGKLVVTVRGVCARVDRATFGARHGAAAVAMINNAAGYPPFEGDIPNVAIAFLGVQGGRSSDGGALAAATSATLTATTLTNPGFQALASFTSGGPRFGDSALKPNITAPGVSIQSTLIGSGNRGQRLSGTSMASPHVAGVAALVRQAHSAWTPDEQRAAILSTADPSKVKDYEARVAGAGLVQASPAARTQAVAIAQASAAQNLSFGFAEIVERELEVDDVVILVNHGASAATFDVTSAASGGSPHAVQLSPRRVSLPPGASARVRVRLTVPAATAGNSDFFREVAGVVTFTPAAGANGGIALRVPYYLVPRARSRMEARVDRPFGATSTTVTATVRNQDGAIPGTADFYAWGASGHADGKGSIDLRAVGVQAFTDSAGRRFLVFAVNSHGRFNTAATNEYDVLVDTNLDGTPDFDVFSFDLGALTAGSFNGQVAVFVQNLATNAISVRFLAVAPTDGSTVLLPVLTSQLTDRARPLVSLTPANPRFSYFARSLNLLTNETDRTDDVGLFNAFSPAIATGDFATVAVGGSARVPLQVDAVEFARTPAKGLMIVNLDDTAGEAQADLLRAGDDD